MRKFLPIIGLALLLAACATATPPPMETVSLPGFWLGLWHGIILPISFIGSLFSDNIAIYSVPNNGGWYDFGFVLGLGVYGGAAAT